MSEAQDHGLEGIAVIGMAGRFPRARDLREFWRNLREGVDCVSYFADGDLDPQPPPEMLRDPSFVKARGVLEDADLFDARFFDVSPRHAELMDPQHRLFLECAHQALEDAGYDPERFPGPVGVFGGVTMSSYFIYNLMTNPELIRSAGGYQIALGSDRDYLTTFVSYKLNLKGPSLDVQTACSTSLVATVLACQSLLSYSCDLALAGGVSVKLPQKSGYLYTPGGLDSATGRCRAFDAGADGSVYGGGVGVVVLKRLEEALADGDEIRAVIRSAAMNNDGSAKVGFTAPGVEGQAEVIATAQALAGIDPETLGYVECHGSGTALGDPIEVTALTKAFRNTRPEGERRRYCAIGSVKTNVGHCSAAAGIAGLLKTVLALEHGEIPPSLHFERPNPVIDFASGPFFVADRLLPWPDGGPRRAGVSSFGLGGTNAHAVLEQAPETDPSGPSRPWQLLLLSAKSEAALEAATDNLAADLEAHPDRSLADVAHTLQVGRRIFNHRRMLVCRDAEDAVRALRERDPRRLLGSYQEPEIRPVAFLFPGLGDHYLGMARGLYETEPPFREQLDRCATLFAPLLGADLRGVIGLTGQALGEIPASGGNGAGPDLRRLLGRAPAERSEAERRLHRTLYAQPAVFAVEYALSQLWMEWGIRPEGLLGYSLGEYVAATVAGVLTLEDAVRLVAERARLIDALPAGAMLAVPLSEEMVRPLLAETGLDLAAVNAPGLCVVAGPEDAVAALQDRLAAEGTPTRRLPTTHAFHSRMMEPAAQALTRLAQGFRLSPPKIPYVSNVTGTWITPAEATDPGYWARHLCQPARFAEGLATLWKNPARVLLEVGPGFGLSTLALQQPAAEERVALPSLRNEHDGQADAAFLLGALGKLWLSGVNVDWSGFYAGERRRRVPLPTYPFERARYWVEPRPFGAPAPVFDDTFLLPGGERVGFDRALEMARAGELIVVEDPALLRRLARLRELEELGVRVVAPAAEAETSPAAPTIGGIGGRHARPNLRSLYVAPAGETESRIAGIYQELLGIESVGVHDSFFELGGHSLLGTSLLSRIREMFGVELPLASLFEQPTVAGLAAAVDARDQLAEAAPPLVPVPRGGDLPLSYAQQRLWFLDRLMPGNPFYNLGGGMRLTGPLDLGTLRAAVQELVRRHETLRTGFADVGGTPVQRIVPEIEIEIPVTDLSALPEEERRATVLRLAREFVRAPFDLSRPGLLRITVLRLREGAEHVLLYAIHHIVSDGWSMGVLIGEIAALYAAFSQGRPSPLPELPVQYADFAVWQRQWLTGEVLERQLAYWRERLTGAPAVELPADRPRPPIQTFRGATHRVLYGRPLLGSLTALARGQDASLFMTLLAAFKALICRVTGQEDLVAGSPIANRTQRELEGLIGFFVNTLVLRTDLAGDPEFTRLLAQVKEVCLGAYAHQDLPFEQLVEELQPRRDLSRNPLFQVMFNLVNTPPPRVEVTGDLAMSPLAPPDGTALFDLQAYVTETPEGLAVSWEYNTDLFDQATVARLSRHFETLLAGIAARPQARLWELPLLAGPEREELLVRWNDTAAPWPAEPTVHALFEAQAARTPAAVALGESLTYAELNARANRLARHLRWLGVGPGTLVGVCLERSPDLVVALLAVLKAGGAYVPLDPAHPADRLRYVLEDAQAPLVIVHEVTSSVLDVLGVPGVLVDDSQNLDDGEVSPAAGPEDLAYVIYTSGSTGRPKGVEVRHAGVVNFLAAMAREPGLGSGDALLAVTTVSFDIAGLELYLPLSVGARVVLASREAAVDGVRLAAMIAEEGITAMQATPATWRLLVGTGWAGDPNLEALCGGEALPRDLAADLLPRVGSLWNLYGPTETTIWSSLHRVTEAAALPIGLPIANTAIHLLDRRLEPVPVGVAGELHIGGAGLARGYLRRPELTAERFVPDPFSAEPGARLYRTGDLARRLRGGAIEFLGRIDHQIKIRGFRVEPGEIEAVLAEDPAVRQAVVIVREDEPGDQRLVAYVVWREGSEREAGRLKDLLRSRVPAYMVPAAFVELESLPLTPSGKVDRRALPRPEGRPQGEKPYEEPVTETARTLAAIWSAVLKVERVGAQDDFFDLGGHSLLATQVVARIRDEFGVELPLPALFQDTTLAALAARIDRERAAAPAAAPLPKLRPRRRDRGAQDLLAQVASLSDAEVRELLRSKQE